MSSPIDSSQWMYNAGGSFYDFEISNSLRFQPDGTTDASIAADNPYLSATLSGSGGTIWTFSCWVKLADLGTNRYLLQGITNTSNYTYVYISNADQVYVYSTTGAYVRLRMYTTLKLRDSSSWYNIVVKFNGTSGSTELKIYINGVNQALTTVNSFTAHQSLIANSNAHYIGNSYNYVRDMAGYMAEVNLIDGTALDADSFGETVNGIWVPKDTSDLTFGDNGFRLEFKQTGTDGDANGIGADTSGETNHFAVGDTDGLGASDVVLDSPTNNFATFNNLLYHGTTYSEGNLKHTSPTTDWETQVATMFPSTLAGKWYAEFYVHTGDATGGSKRVGVGVTDDGNNPEDYLGNQSPDVAYYDINDIYTGGNKTADTDATYVAGDIISVALDLDAGEVTFRKNNSTMSNGTQNLVASTLYTFATTTYGHPAGVVANFGQDDTFAGNKTSGSAGASDGNGQGDFYYAPPSGFLALCSANLLEPTIGPNSETQADDHFNTVLYTGNGHTTTNTQSITGIGFQPDWAWIKNRNGAGSHSLFDSVRGAGKALLSNSTAAETSQNDSLTSFDSDGFSLGDNSESGAHVNVNNSTYVAWNWKAGGSSNTFNIDGTGHSAASAASLDGGDLTPTGASINTTAGISIIGYTGNGTGASGQTIKHGLSSPPELIFIKDRVANSNNSQFQASSSVVGDKYAYLSTTAAFTSSSLMLPTSGDNTTVTLGIGGNAGIRNTTNESGDAYIMYLFHSVEGYQKIGLYEGNGNADGTYVNVGFRPAFLLAKSVDSTSSWYIFDNKREGYNPDNDSLLADTTGTEPTTDIVDLLSNGFKLRRSADPNIAETFVYLAIAAQPFKYANAR